jgi:hypothetical protein
MVQWGQYTVVTCRHYAQSLCVFNNIATSLPLPALFHISPPSELHRQAGQRKKTGLREPELSNTSLTEAKGGASVCGCFWSQGSVVYERREGGREGGREREKEREERREGKVNVMQSAVAANRLEHTTQIFAIQCTMMREKVLKF